MAYVSDRAMTSMMLDVTIVRCHACAAGYGKDTQEKEALKQSEGDVTNKMHTRVDVLGNPIQCMLAPG